MTDATPRDQPLAGPPPPDSPFPTIHWTASADGATNDLGRQWHNVVAAIDETRREPGWLQITHPDDAAGAVAAWHHATTTGAPFDVRRRIRMADGSYRWSRSRALLHVSPRSGGRRWYGVTEDIHDQPLDAATPDTPAVLALAPSADGPADPAMLVLDPAGRIVSATPALAALFGHDTAAEMAGLPLATLLPVSIGPAEWRDSTPREVLGRHRDGRDLHLELTLLPFAVPGAAHPGGPTMCSGVLRNIAHRFPATGTPGDNAERQRLAGEAVTLFSMDIDLVASVATLSANMFPAIGLPCPPDCRIPLSGLFDLVHPADRDRVIATNRGIAHVPGSHRSVHRIIRPDTGEIRWVERHGTVLIGADGSRRMISVVRDITEQREAELALAEREERLRLTIEVAKIFSMEGDIETGEITVTPRTYEVHGMSPDQDMHTNLARMRATYHPDDLPYLAATSARVLREGGSDTATFRIIRADNGETRWIERHLTRRITEDGRRLLLSVARDVTESKRAELDLAATAERLRLTIEAARMFIIEGDLETGEAVVMPRAFEVHGIPPTPDGRITLARLRDTIHPDDKANIIERTQRLLDDGGTDFAVMRIIRPATGETRWVERTAAVLTCPEGKRSIVAIARDITERKRAEIELAETAERLRLVIAAAQMFILEADLATGEATAMPQTFAAHFVEPTPDGRTTLAAMRAHVHPDDLPGVIATSERLYAEGGTNIDSIRLVTPGTGEIRWLERHVTVRNASDGSRRLISLEHDVTERKRAELALAEREERLRLAVESAGMFLIDLDLDTGSYWLSHNMFELAGVTPPPDGKISRHERQRHIHPDDLPRLTAIHDRVAHEDGATATTYRLRNVRTGAVRWLESYGSVVTGPEGRRRWIGIERDITERREAEQALAASETRLRLALESTGFGIWETQFAPGPDIPPGTDLTAAPGITIWSARMFRLLGYPPAPDGRASPQMWLDRLHPDDREAAATEWQHHDPGHFPNHNTYRVIHPDGQVVWLDSYRRRVVLPDGSRRIVGLVRDITAERGAQSALEQAEQRLAYAVEATREGLWDWNIATGMVWRSARWREMLGLDRTNEFGRLESWESLIHPDDLPLRRQALDDHLAGRTAAYECEHRVRHADGSWLWVLARAKVVQRDEAGTPVRMVGTIQDITQRREMQGALAASVSQFEAVLATIPECVKILTPDAKVLSINAAGLAMGQVPDAALVIGSDICSVVAEDDQETWLRNHARICAGESLRWEYELVGLSGRRLRLETAGTPIRLPDGRIAHLAVGRDVTARRAAETRLAQLQADAMRAARVNAMAAMAAGFAHEINQPLGAVANYAATATLMLEAATGPTMSPDTRATLASILRKAGTQALRAGSIVRRLRDFIGQAGTEVASLSPADLLHESRDTVRAALAGRGPIPRIAIEVDDTMAPLLADRAQLHQVLTNLIRNAIDATAEMPSPRITVRAWRGEPGRRVDFAVTDNGPGVCPEIAPRLFEPFVTTKSGGMGIGLKICRTVVEAHGGEIWVEPGPGGKGTSFRFTIPDPELAAPPE